MDGECYVCLLWTISLVNIINTAKGGMYVKMPMKRLGCLSSRDLRDFKIFKLFKLYSPFKHKPKHTAVLQVVVLAVTMHPKSSTLFLIFKETVIAEDEEKVVYLSGNGSKWKGETGSLELHRYFNLDFKDKTRSELSLRKLKRKRFLVYVTVVIADKHDGQCGQYTNARIFFLNVFSNVFLNLYILRYRICSVCSVCRISIELAENVSSVSRLFHIILIDCLCQRQQTSGIFVCTFSFLFLSVDYLCSITKIYSVSLGEIISSTDINVCLSLHNPCSINTISCLFRSVNDDLTREVTCHKFSFYSLYESLGLHTRTYTRFYSVTLYLFFFSNRPFITNTKFILCLKIIPLFFVLSSIASISNSVNKHSGIRLLLLLCGDVERNPGPSFNNKKLIILTQNCRGLNNNMKLKHLMSNKSRIVKNDHFILALQETYLIDDSTIGWCGTHVFTKAESIHSAGCITFFPDTVRIIEKKDIDDKGHGHLAVVEGLGDKLAIVINVYAPVRSLNNQQKIFYETLEMLIDELETKYVMYEPNLLIMGDFNLPLEPEMANNSSEKARARALSEYFSSLGLVDCWKQEDKRTTLKGGNSRLDRILYRIQNEVKATLKIDWTFTKSDHSMVNLMLEDRMPRQRGRRIVSLPTYIMDIPTEKQSVIEGMLEFKNMIEEGWNSHTKLEFLKTGLRTVVGEIIKQRNRREREELEGIQTELERRMTFTRTISLRAMEENQNEIEVLFARRNNILEAKCEAMAAKAKMKWFHEGEKPSKYFLNIIRKRRAVTDIKELEINGLVTTNENNIKSEITAFYKNLYEQGGSQNNIDDDFFMNVNNIPTAVADALTVPLLKDEILQTLKTCSDSAPGPDGIPYSYYRHLWDIFGDIIVESWQDSLNNDTLPPSHRNSILKLLPKEGKNLTKLNNWRPITLSNCDHKLITKCYAKRMTSILQSHLHPNQTAYLPGKQIHDNLRLLDIINKQAEDSIMIALDAKKAFDSITHEYIRKILEKYGLGSFIPIFNLLYSEQKVDIAINGDVIPGYNIKNGVKQGDSLSCILFILGMDPLIRNIEDNPNIGRVQIPACSTPKILAYADDVTCITDSVDGIKEIFKEYERLSKASGLMLNADKTEIINRNARSYSFRYMNVGHRVISKKEAKINGIYFNCNNDIMKQRNYEMLCAKINSALLLWQTRRLSLLGKILIYKTYGLSQLIYVLTVVELDPAQYKQIHLMFTNFLWGRDMNNGSNRNRISWQRLNNPIEKGGFGMIHFKDIIDSIRCRQFGKMFEEKYTHPLKQCILNENKSYASWQCLKEGADLTAKSTVEILKNNLLKTIKNLSNDEIASDTLLIQRLAEIETFHTIKNNKRMDDEAMILVHHWGCANLKDVFVQSRQHRTVLAICRRIMTAKFFRIVKLIHQRNINPQIDQAVKIMLASKNYKHIAEVTSKEFRLLLQNKNSCNVNKVGERFDEHTSKAYFAQIKRLISTKHKNTLLRVWNGDCLSYSRLHRFGIVETDRCPRCNEFDSPEHMLLTCEFSKQTWELLQQKIPRRTNCSWLRYAIGVNDTCAIMMVKAEVLKFLMHFRELEPASIINKTIAFLKTVNRYNREILSL